ncbi:MAG TPA: septum formation initiator family protein [Candidatus Saccharimonadales bacterium]|jgi:cell division protein FtsB|nr:septum formation initiator family protein [Candidatus Saccharimonadales bacterium]
MQAKIKQYQEKIMPYVYQLRDVRVMGLVMFLVVVLLISWSGAKVIDTNYGLQKQISQLEQQTQVQQLKNNNLKLQNEYYNSNQYLELTARANFGLAAPGEKELIVPQTVALAHTTNVPSLDQTQPSKAPAKQPAYQRHFQAWMDFFLHRQSPQ